MADKRPFWSLCVSDFFGSTTCASMTGLQESVYLKALARCWDSGCLPADSEELRKLLRIERQWWKANSGAVLAAFTSRVGEHGPYLIHARIEEQRSQLKDLSRVRSEAGKKGNEARWSQLRQVCDRKTSLPSPSPSPSEEKKETLSSNRKPIQRRKYPAGFEEFWKAYPTRRGKRAGKGETYDKWTKVAAADRNLLVTAAGIYGRSMDAQNGFAKDPVRFLKSEYWRDWLDSPGEVSHDPDEEDDGKMTPERFESIMDHVRKERDERKAHEEEKQ